MSTETTNMNVDQEITEDKFLRKDLDDLIQRTKAMPSTRERALSITKMQEAVMWLGMDLKRIGEQNPEKLTNPYPNSKDPTNDKIDPTADKLKL